MRSQKGIRPSVPRAAASGPRSMGSVQPNSASISRVWASLLPRLARALGRRGDARLSVLLRGKTQASLAEKMSKVALEAAEKSTEISSKWTLDTIGKMGSVATVKEEPADYGKAMTDFASAQAEMAAENMAAFAEVAKKVQMETVELMLAAGKDFSEDATAAVKKATAEVSAAAKKAAA